MYPNQSDYEQQSQNQNPAQNQSADHHTETQKPAAPGYGTQSTPYTVQTGGSQPGVPMGSPYMPGQPTTPYGAQQPVRTAYTWNPQNTMPTQQTAPYYAPVQPAQKPKRSKKKGGKFALKVVCVLLACAVVSFGSVGVFALMIQNGIVNVQSAGETGKTAAFTIYKQAESDKTTSTAVAGEVMTQQEVAQKLIPSVVCVQNYQVYQQSTGFFFGFGDYGYSNGSDDSSLSPVGEGSGIIISKDGYIVTNQHVIDGATNLKVVTSEGLTYEATLVGEDTQTDLAVIKIDTEDELTPAEFGSSEDLQVADEVMAIGNPGGLQLNSSVTFGHVSALNRPVTNSETGYTVNCIQTDAAINPGNSGGALVDNNGHVVGINSSKIAATEYEGLGFAIPADTVQPIVSDLIEYGYVKDRAMAGFSGQYIDWLNARFYGMDAGYYVTQLNSEEAAASGLRRGDRIVAIDDVQVTSASVITVYIASKKPGDTVTLTIEGSLSGQRSGEIQLVLPENTGSSDDTIN